MTPEAMAGLHARAFTAPPPWSVSDFAALLARPEVFAVVREDGFALGRAIAGEAELLTLAVQPGARRRGVGRALLAGFLEEARMRGAARAFLEVGEDNLAARGLYAAAGFMRVGRRRGYLRTPEGVAADALVLARDL